MVLFEALPAEVPGSATRNSGIPEMLPDDPALRVRRGAPAARASSR